MRSLVQPSPACDNSIPKVPPPSQTNARPTRAAARCPRPYSPFPIRACFPRPSRAAGAARALRAGRSEPCRGAAQRSDAIDAIFPPLSQMRLASEARRSQRSFAGRPRWRCAAPLARAGCGLAERRSPRRGARGHPFRDAARHRDRRRRRGRRSSLPGALADPRALAAILGEVGALTGNRTFTLADALVGADAIDIARLPEIGLWRRLPDALAPGALPRARPRAGADRVHAGREAVHLRFLVGTAIAGLAPTCSRMRKVGNWGVPLAKAWSELGAGGVSVLALPRAPQRLLPAVSAGRAAQREVSAQLFASNALRKFRGSVGEPTAVISAHRASGRPRRRGVAAVAVVAVRPPRRRRLPLSAPSSRSRRRRGIDAGRVATRLPGDRHPRTGRCARRSRRGFRIAVAVQARYDSGRRPSDRALMPKLTSNRQSGGARTNHAGRSCRDAAGARRQALGRGLRARLPAGQALRAARRRSPAAAHARRSVRRGARPGLVRQRSRLATRSSLPTCCSSRPASFTASRTSATISSSGCSSTVPKAGRPTPQGRRATT